MVTLISLYGLRLETDSDEFLKWVRNVDLPKTQGRPGVIGFEMFMVPRDDGAPGAGVIEMIELESEEAFAKLGATSGDDPAAGDFDWLADPQLVRNVFCQRIE